MNVASLELSKKLYELSGWDSYDLQAWSDSEVVAPSNIPLRKLDCPAYDCGYLLRKLPIETLIIKSYKDYVAIGEVSIGTLRLRSDKPEDALAKLCIAMFEQGILKRN